MEKVLDIKWYTFPISNIDFDFWDDNLEIQIQVSETDDGLYGEALRYCYDDGDGPREYLPHDNNGPFSPRVIERLTQKFFKANTYTMLEAA